MESKSKAARVSGHEFRLAEMSDDARTVVLGHLDVQSLGSLAGASHFFTDTVQKFLRSTSVLYVDSSLTMNEQYHFEYFPFPDATRSARMQFARGVRLAVNNAGMVKRLIFKNVVASLCPDE